jgi:hypothetical protein
LRRRGILLNFFQIVQAFKRFTAWFAFNRFDLQPLFLFQPPALYLLIFDRHGQSFFLAYQHNQLIAG